jgi:hypothetical protein
MDPRQEILEFLTSRRAKLTAHDVGLPNYVNAACAHVGG